MGKMTRGRYIYSMDDCRCDLCLYFDSKTHLCRLEECCCPLERQEALFFFPPDGFERKEARHAVGNR